MEDILSIVLIFGGRIAIALAFSPIGRAVGERIPGGSPPQHLDPAPPDAVRARGAGGDAVLQELEQLRHEVAELAERVDFTERLLAKGRDGETGKLAPGERRTAST